MSSPMASLQSLGRALMLPIAVLPVAGLLLRLGQPDLLNIAFMANAGNAIFDNLGLLFAVGVATAFARDGNGAAALAGITCYLVTIKGAETLIVPPAGTGGGLAKDIAATVEAAEGAVERSTTDLGRVVLAADAFGACAALSIDFAVMERSDRVGVVPVAMD